jgi:hypothetical protein
VFVLLPTRRVEDYDRKACDLTILALLQTGAGGSWPDYATFEVAGIIKN